ncbi:MAG: aminotransferase class I/II-fold pyridoxal phosphate-dependent enzyme [Firmicutes bacterium]|nr:aminotransferase class I/II-fold pyridoxal phosphate-dependent enzyme [Bacillota bacterium]
MDNRQDRTPLFDSIMEYNRIKPSYFRIPGHRYAHGINQKWRDAVGDGIFGFDLTETYYTDDLHNASTYIKEAEDLASELWGTDYTHFLVNGSTCGNQAMVMTVCGGGGKIAIPRNAHKSALMGLIMGGGKPVYITPQIEPEWGLHGGITPQQVEDMFKDNPDCKGVMVVSPTYYGLASDIEGIAEVCHRHGAVLFVDEAHGAHCYFSERLPKGAIQQGADMCVQSIHKVTGSFTQSSMLHVKSKLVDRAVLEANLHLVQSTSPSYILMTSLDLARHDLAMRGPEMIDAALSLAQDARQRINKIPGVKCAGREIIGRAGIHELDETRLVISCADMGITGFDMKKLLFYDYNIDIEVTDYRNFVAIVTYANVREDLDNLVAALQDISDKNYGVGKPLQGAEPLPPLPEYVLSPRESYYAKKTRIPWSECKGRIMGEMIAPYPPGIPVIYNGERMSDEVWEYLERFRVRKGHLQGPSDPTLETVLVIEE